MQHIYTIAICAPVYARNIAFLAAENAPPRSGIAENSRCVFENIKRGHVREADPLETDVEAASPAAKG